MAITERALRPQEIKEIADHAARALGLLALPDPHAPPEAVLDALDDFIDRWQERQRSPLKRLLSRGPAPNPTATALGLGFVWGDQLARRFGWEWTCVQEGGAEAYAVAPPDRALIIYPTHFLKACLADPRADCTVMLAFNMLADGQMAGMPARGYENVMAGVRRVVPKR